MNLARCFNVQETLAVDNTHICSEFLKWFSFKTFHLQKEKKSMTTSVSLDLMKNLTLQLFCKQRQTPDLCRVLFVLTSWLKFKLQSAFCTTDLAIFELVFCLTSVRSILFLLIWSVDFDYSNTSSIYGIALGSLV